MKKSFFLILASAVLIITMGCGRHERIDPKVKQDFQAIKAAISSYHPSDEAVMVNGTNGSVRFGAPEMYYYECMSNRYLDCVRGAFMSSTMKCEGLGGFYELEIGTDYFYDDKEVHVYCTLFNSEAASLHFVLTDYLYAPVDSLPDILPDSLCLTDSDNGQNHITISRGKGVVELSIDSLHWTRN